MEQQDRDMLVEIHTNVKRIVPLVESHDRDINRGKGVVLVITLFLGWLFGTSK